MSTPPTNATALATTAAANPGTVPDASALTPRAAAPADRAALERLLTDSGLPTAGVSERLVADAERRGLDALYLLTTTAEHYFPRFGFARVERGAVPSETGATVEFRSACPASAVAMARPLGAHAAGPA